jgi:hypothetical protein
MTTFGSIKNPVPPDFWACVGNEIVVRSETKRTLADLNDEYDKFIKYASSGGCN